jgi:hypothetical protein
MYQSSMWCHCERTDRWWRSDIITFSFVFQYPHPWALSRRPLFATLKQNTHWGCFSSHGEIFPHCGFILSVLVWFSVRCHRITDEGWNYPTSRSGSLIGLKGKILFLALAVRFNIAVNICHLLGYYFLELLLIFDILITSVLPNFN